MNDATPAEFAEDIDATGSDGDTLVAEAHSASHATYFRRRRRAARERRLVDFDLLRPRR